MKHFMESSQMAKSHQMVDKFFCSGCKHGFFSTFNFTLSLVFHEVSASFLPIILGLHRDRQTDKVGGWNFPCWLELFVLVAPADVDSVPRSTWNVDHNVVARLVCYGKCTVWYTFGTIRLLRSQFFSSIFPSS